MPKFLYLFSRFFRISKEPLSNPKYFLNLKVSLFFYLAGRTMLKIHILKHWNNHLLIKS